MQQLGITGETCYDLAVLNTLFQILSEIKKAVLNLKTFCLVDCQHDEIIMGMLSKLGFSVFIPSTIIDTNDQRLNISWGLSKLSTFKQCTLTELFSKAIFEKYIKKDIKDWQDIFLTASVASIGLVPRVLKTVIHNSQLVSKLISKCYSLATCGEMSCYIII
jgi:hypothetical protein